MTKSIIKRKVTGPKRQLKLSPPYKALTQGSTGLIFISADIISIKEKKRDKICNVIKSVKYFHIFITFFFLELWLSDHNQCNYEQPAGVLAFSAPWGPPPAALHSQLWLQASGTPASKKERLKWIFVIASSIKPSTLLFWSWSSLSADCYCFYTKQMGSFLFPISFEPAGIFSYYSHRQYFTLLGYRHYLVFFPL